MGSEKCLHIVNGLEIRPTSCNGWNPVHDLGKQLPYQVVPGFHQPLLRCSNFLCHSVGANNLERPSSTPKYLTKSSVEVDSQASSPAVMGLGMLKYVLGFWVVEQLIPVALSSFCPFHVGIYHEMPQPLWTTSNAFAALRWLQTFSVAMPPSAVARRRTPGMLRYIVLWWPRRHCSQMPLAP